MGTYVSNVLTKRLVSTGTVSAGPCRLLAIYFVADTTGGSIELKDGGSGGTSKVKLNKAAHVHDMTINFPVPILFKTNVNTAFTTEQITAITVFHSGGNNS